MQKHKLPHSRYAIKQMMDAGKYAQAMAACDANVEWHRAQAAEFQDRWRDAQIRKGGGIPLTSVPYTFGPVLDPKEQANR